MKNLNKQTVSKDILPITIIQFGEGNFLRAFIDWMVDIMNTENGFDKGIAIVQPIKTGKIDVLDRQNNLYHHISRGIQKGKIQTSVRLIKSIQKSVNPFEDIEAYKELALLEHLEMVVSNTTEAGILFSDNENEMTDLPETFPGKVTKLLWDRYRHFQGDKDKGLKFLPVELIENNGDKLKEAILNYAQLWKLEDEFIDWIEHYNYFANTLVDRIVTGFPADEIDQLQKEVGFKDDMFVASELFHLFIIKAPKEIQSFFPADKLGFNVKYVDDITPYRTQKVRILNGSHTCMVPMGLYKGKHTVGDFINDKELSEYLNQIIFNEIIPTIELPEEELETFANEVIDRFRNPFIKHQLTAISLNTISKYKVRVLPTIIDYFYKYKALPNGLLKAFSFMINMYMSGDYPLKDEDVVLRYFNDLRKETLTDNEVIRKLMGKTEFWGQDLNAIPGLSDQVLAYYNEITHKNESYNKLK